ncbi:DeoR family transcriptional regulator [Paenibacillus sacheonensis]|uniref:DeoR family transcriptional regulator n=2 Tax=Paenibacillus sacheonensis TaxID=742054 RepID=A0A7X5C3R5_9BACL|nr:DeoR/GlpR family DNA-binding transcription regulator [Paenibacillus sacheonensis]MBM7566977.1 DeoR/GlpR family transcriptional regulator of sugar metabolism [Paenibacillus sacheonensis]NBC71599.1 DeoR family transcriptional regulator [Paenibacillus sacheonensis]
MNPLRRYEKIMELLLAEREVTVAKLTEQLRVTGKTIREDLAKLEEKGLLARIHGGAVLAQENQLGILSPKPAAVPNEAERSETAAAAIALIGPHDVIALDGGRTTLEMARRLPDQPMTVVTNDLFILAELARKEQIRLVVPGGYQYRNMLIGSEAEAYIRKLNISKAFLSATGVHPTYGFTIYAGESVQLKRAWLETAKASYVVADHYKFGQAALFTFAKLSEVEAIITDSGIEAETAELFRQEGTHILIHGREGQS